MASTTAPSTPEQQTGRRTMALNRSFTVPGKLEGGAGGKANVEIGAREGVETLFVHPRANIVKFNTPASRPSPAPSRPGQAPPTLQWASPSERTLAAGPLEIYRIPGSVSFLHSGTLLHAIMPRSQCWCVDGVSKFAMRVLKDTYYRIELPGETEEDLALVEGMKECLKKVLWYERTPCPFSRAFHVELPDEPELDVRKGRRRSEGPAKKWRMDRAYSWKPEDGVWPERSESVGSSARGSHGGSDEDSDSSRQDPEVPVQEQEERDDEIRELQLNTPSRPKALSAATRSVTAPPQLTLRSTPPSRSRVQERVQEFADGRIEVKETTAYEPSRLENSRLRTFHVIPTDMPPSPPDSSAGVDPFDNTARQATEGASQEEADTSLLRIKETTEDSTEGPDSSVHSLEETRDDSPEAIADNTAHVAEEQLDSANKSILEAESQDAILEAGCQDAIPVEASTSEPSEAQARPTLQPAAELEDSLSELPEPARIATSSGVEGITTSAELSPSSDDPFAAIQARIRARRNVGALNAQRSSSPVDRKASSNSASSSSSRLTAKTSSASSSLSHKRSQSSLPRNQSLTAAMVQRACSVFLGPPAHLVAIMLRIASRLTHGAFGAIFVESPAGMAKRIPGSYFLEEEGEDDDVFGPEAEWEEDDFGVPLRSPVRLATLGLQGDAREDEAEVMDRSGRTSWSVD